MSCWVPRLFFHWLGDLPSKRWISMTLGCWLLAKPQLQMVNYPLNKWQQFWATGWSSLLISLAFIGVNNAEITAGLRKRVGDIYYISSACLICSSDYFLEPCWNSDLVNYLFLIYSFLSQQQIANYRIKVLIKISEFVCLKAKDKPTWFPWTTNLSIVCHIYTVKLLPEVSCSYSTFKLDFDLLLFSFPWPLFPSCPIWRISYLPGTKLCQYSGAWVNVTK